MLSEFNRKLDNVNFVLQGIFVVFGLPFAAIFIGRWVYEAKHDMVAAVISGIFTWVAIVVIANVIINMATDYIKRKNWYRP